MYLQATISVNSLDPQSAKWIINLFVDERNTVDLHILYYFFVNDFVARSLFAVRCSHWWRFGNWIFFLETCELIYRILFTFLQSKRSFFAAKRSVAFVNVNNCAYFVCGLLSHCIFTFHAISGRTATYLVPPEQYTHELLYFVPLCEPTRHLAPQIDGQSIDRQIEQFSINLRVKFDSNWIDKCVNCQE